MRQAGGGRHSRGLRRPRREDRLQDPRGPQHRPRAYMLILGEKEVEAGNISVRDRSNETVQMSVDEFVAKVLEEIKTRA